MTHSIGTKADIKAIQDDVDKLMGYPSKGINVGSGRHVAIPETFTPGAKGWTVHHQGVRKHPTKDEYALELDDEVSAALADSEKRKRLTAEKLAKLDAEKTDAKKLPADWEPVEEPVAVERKP